MGDTVFAVGNPQGLEGTFSQGIVSGIRQFDADSLLQITAPISPGSSGGPVVDSEGKVVGVAVATFKGGQNLNFAIPAKYVDELLQKAGKSEPLSSKTSKTSKSILDELGGSKSTEGVYAHNLDPQYLIIGSFSFSLANRLREPVKNIKCLVIFYDTEENPLDFSVVEYSDVIPAGLGKRVKGQVSPSAGQLYQRQKGKIEFRILGFEIEQEQ